MYRRDEGDDDDDNNNNNNNNNNHVDRCGVTRRKKCRAKGSRKGAKLQEFMYRDTTNVESGI
jgi:hypothetical protein